MGSPERVAEVLTGTNFAFEAECHWEKTSFTIADTIRIDGSTEAWSTIDVPLYSECTISETDSGGADETPPPVLLYVDGEVEVSFTNSFTDDASAISAVAIVPTLQQGATQTGYGYGFQPGEVVVGEQRSVPLSLGTQVADAAGTVTFVWAIRVDEVLGAHDFVVTGAQSGTASTSFTVIPGPVAAQPPSVGPLPVTGPTSTVPFTLATVLVLLGAGCMLVVRRGYGLTSR